ncbi:hypothetical protein KC343_g7334 [Hortaea werneckii]|nr:hypothetical protein KC338_g5323 [Hortaea werneckii]KAI6873197.1 hypothetical protein KC323_g1203 [Hortaea werneckii]KAI7203313.1 hypothetical protein KC352_g18816 [Hortaea werneckii]KAI7346667.1 hypothetical protein KC320_g7695 [Hortaea werneckii]KAI7563546.1 hypothetical protein KC317_g7652 [Hortaea werneckii]
MATTIDLPSPELDILSTDLFPVGRSLTFEGQILQAQNIAIMTMLQDIRRTLHQGSGTVSADETTKSLVAPSGAPTRTPRATPRVSKASGTVSADETTKSLVAPTREWLAEGSKKANSDNHRELYKLMNTDGARVMATKWYDEVASLGEDRAWSEGTIQKHFKLVSKLAIQAANEESGGTHAEGKKGKEAKQGRKKATKENTNKRVTPEDHHSNTSPSCARPPKVSKQSHDAEDEDSEPVAAAVARKARRYRVSSDDDDDDDDDEEEEVVVVEAAESS